jgi:hypothetical protein
MLCGRVRVQHPQGPAGGGAPLKPVDTQEALRPRLKRSLGVVMPPLPPMKIPEKFSMPPVMPAAAAVAAPPAPLAPPAPRCPTSFAFVQWKLALLAAVVSKRGDDAAVATAFGVSAPWFKPEMWAAADGDVPSAVIDRLPWPCCVVDFEGRARPHALKCAACAKVGVAAPVGSVATPRAWLQDVAPMSPVWTVMAPVVAAAGPGISLHTLREVHNTYAWARFATESKCLDAFHGKACPTVALWHGTRGVPPEQVALSREGLDPRRSRVGLLGRAAYLAGSLLYALHYAHVRPAGGLADAAGHHVLLLDVLLCWVLPGHVHDAGISPMKDLLVPPAGKDSVRGQSPLCGGTKMWAVYTQGQVYPAYVVTVKVSVPCSQTLACVCGKFRAHVRVASGSAPVV